MKPHRQCHISPILDGQHRSAMQGGAVYAARTEPSSRFQQHNLGVSHLPKNRSRGLGGQQLTLARPADRAHLSDTLPFNPHSHWPAV